MTGSASPILTNSITFIHTGGAGDTVRPRSETGDEVRLLAGFALLRFSLLLWWSRSRLFFRGSGSDSIP